MKQSLVIALIMLAASSSTLGGPAANKGPAQKRNPDEQTLTQMARAWTNAWVQRDLQTIERITSETFQGEAGGVKYNKKMLLAGLSSHSLTVQAWTVENLKVTVHGNAGVMTGQSKLSGASYMGKDYSGQYQFTARFVRDKDGTWRGVAMTARLVKPN
jgi:hypothetical protein